MTCDKCEHSLLCWSATSAPNNWVVCPACQGAMILAHPRGCKRKQYWHYWQCDTNGQPGWMVELRQRQAINPRPRFVLSFGQVSYGYCVRCRPLNWSHTDRRGKPFARIANLDIHRDRWRAWRETLALSLQGVTTNLPESGLLQYNVGDTVATTSLIITYKAE